MQTSFAYGQVRAFLVTILLGLAVAGLTTLTAHYATQASDVEAENAELRQQVRDLVTRLAELEAIVSEVGRERQSVEDATLATLGTVLDYTTIEPEKNGPLYLASLSSTDRNLASAPKTPAGPPTSVANMAALVERTARLRENATTLVRDLKTTSKVLAARHEVLAAIPSRLPADGWISSSYGIRNSPFHSGDVMHKGMDIAADEGTPVYAPADGEVMFAGVFGGFGKYIRISHGYGIGTRYAHNAEILVKKGQKIRRGDQIAVIGSTGRSTGPHLHYEVLIHGEPIDPARFVLDDSAKKPSDLIAAQVADRPLGVGGEFLDDPSAFGGSGKEELDPTSPSAWQTDRLVTATYERPILPGLLGQTTTRDMILLVGTLLLMAIAGSLVRLPEGATAHPDSLGRSHERSSLPVRLDRLDVWTRPTADDEAA